MLMFPAPEAPSSIMFARELRVHRAPVPRLPPRTPNEATHDLCARRMRATQQWLILPAPIVARQRSDARPLPRAVRLFAVAPRALLAEPQLRDPLQILRNSAEHARRSRARRQPQFRGIALGLRWRCVSGVVALISCPVPKFADLPLDGRALGNILHRFTYVL